jgi:HKD family nuclease
MQNYKEKLSTLDKEDSDELISNGSKKHAQALIYQFLDGAKNSVNIISKNLSIYNNQEIVGALNMALTKGVQIKILLDDYQNNKITNNIFLDNCIENKNCKIKIYDKPLKAHIITRDNNAFRYCNSPGSNIAVASFNRPDVVKNAKEKVFSAFFEGRSEYVVA